MLSVIVNHYKSPVALKLCLRSIREALQKVPHEVIVSDSAAEPATSAFIGHDFPEAHYIAFEKNVGFSKIVNAGMKAAKGDFILLLNADNIVIQGTVERLIEYLEEHPDVGVVGPRLEYQNGEHQPSAFRFYTPLIIFARRTLLGKTQRGKRALDTFMMREATAQSISAREPITVDWLMGSALLTRKKAVEEVGLFDERFFMYFEDVDWCHRFWKKGWKVVWIPDVRIVHVHAQASKKHNALFDLALNPYTRIHLRSAIRYFRKHGLKTPRYGA